MIRCAWSLIPAVLACVAGAAAATTPEQLLARAKAARARAEKDLAGARQRHLAQRKALAAELQRAYDDLAAAGAGAKAASESLERLRRSSAGLERDEALTRHRIRALLAQAAASAGADVKPTGAIESMERGIWEGFQQRLDGVEAALAATVASEAVVGRDGNEHRVAVLRLGGYAVYACGDSRQSCGLLGGLPDGRQRIVGPYLDAAAAEALRAGAGGRLTRLPIDVDGSLRDRAPAEPKTVGSWLEAGGLFIYPIILVGAVGVLLVLERVGHLVLARARPSLVRETLARLGQGDVNGARELLAGSRGPAARVLLAGVDSAGKPEDQREAAMESTLLAEAPRLERSLSLLAALAGVAPLLGLLGTVSGMIATFDTISAAGTGNPRLLSGGISEALITTQLGLMVAIPLLLAHAGLRRWVERREALLEHDAIRVLGVNQDDSAEGIT